MQNQLWLFSFVTGIACILNIMNKEWLINYFVARGIAFLAKSVFILLEWQRKINGEYIFYN